MCIESSYSASGAPSVLEECGGLCPGGVVVLSGCNRDLGTCQGFISLLREIRDSCCLFYSRSSI